MLTRRAFLTAAGAVALGRGAGGAGDDLVIAGGRVVDPSQRVDRVANVAIAAGRVRAIDSHSATRGAATVIDARGKIVTPGLIDLHVHLGPDLTPELLLADGVTSMVDGGSAGADNIDALVAIARTAPNRVRIFLNIARTGVTGSGELKDISAADVEAARAAIERYRDWIVGVKVRLSANVVGDRDLEALRRARAAAGPLPVMLHVGQTFSPLPDILALLNPGDIVTHIYSPPPHSALDDRGHVLAAVREARTRGVRFDVGNGRSGHITWPVVDAATRDLFWPDTISSDITAPGRTFRVFDLPTIVSKFLMLGLPLDRAIDCVTRQAAAHIRAFAGLGTLRPGSPADVAIFELREGDFTFVDNDDAQRSGRQKLVASAAVFGGRLQQGR